MAKVKRGEVRFMVATDIAARGIDISDLSHVINYSLPEDPAVFLHRVGRTGRIGKKGTSLSIISGGDIHTLSALQKKYGIVFEEKKLPTPEEARRVWTDRHVAELKEAMSSSIFEAFIPLSQELRTRQDGEWLVAFALKYFFTHHRIERVQDQQKAEHKREEHERREKDHGRDRPHEGGRGRDGELRARSEHDGRGREARRERPEREGRRGRAEGAARRERPEREARHGREHDAGGEGAEQAHPTVAVEATPTAGGGAEAPAEPTGQRPRARVFLSLGEMDGADEAKVREAVAALAPGVDVRGVELRRSHSFLEVGPEAIDAAVAALHGKEWHGKALTAERARRRRR